MLCAGGLSPRRFFGVPGCYRFLAMTRSAQARSDNRRFASGIAVGLALLAALLALPGCATMGNPPASDVDSPLDATSQSNLTR
jgi:hypothetical protein